MPSVTAEEAPKLKPYLALVNSSAASPARSTETRLEGGQHHL